MGMLRVSKSFLSPTDVAELLGKATGDVVRDLDKAGVPFQVLKVPPTMREARVYHVSDIEEFRKTYKPRTRKPRVDGTKKAPALG